MLRIGTFFLFSILLLTNAVCATQVWSSGEQSKATLGNDYKTFQSSFQASGTALQPSQPVWRSHLTAGACTGTYAEPGACLFFLGDAHRRGPNSSGRPLTQP